MKKLLGIFILLCFSFCNVALADYGWENPKSIRVYIEQNDKKMMMKEAFAKWTKLTNGRLVFKYVTSASEAQIHVKFVKDASKASRGLEDAIGVTHTSYKMSGKGKPVLAKATIEIANHAPGEGGRLMPKDRIYRVMVHEIGHAVGFQGAHAHSADKQSVMYPAAVSRNQVVTPADLKFLGSIYGW